jgi:4-hydroxyphenylacetate 3-monooxygenase
MRSGREYIEALRDDRTVYLSGERVRDVPDHLAFASAAQTVAHLYDFALDPAYEMSYAPEADSSTRANRVFMIPRSGEDLKARRLASTRDVELTRNQFFVTPAHVLGNTQARYDWWSRCNSSPVSDAKSPRSAGPTPLRK